MKLLLYIVASFYPYLLGDLTGFFQQIALQRVFPSLDVRIFTALEVHLSYIP